jgi:DNA-binding NarL/FixJ family response regulator
VSVVVADDNGLFRSALDAILAAEASIVVVGRATDGEEAIKVVSELLDGFLATQRIQEQALRTRVLVLTGSPERADVERAEAAGAAGYVTKDRIASELVAAIHAVAKGG